MKFNTTFAAVAALFVLAAGGPLYGQTAADMDQLLESREITWAQACRFVLPAAGAPEEEPAGAAFEAARQNGWLPKGAAADRPVTLGGLSFLIKQSFAIKGSVLYAVFPGPRYAYRHLDYLKLLPGPRDPALKISGDRLLRILGAVLNYRGDGELAAVPEPAAPAELSQDGREEQREQMAQEIRGELNTGGVADTTVRVVEKGVTISLDNIQFLPDDTALIEGEQLKLRQVAVILRRYPGRKILVGGHTALAGTEAGRLEVSARRAQAVADFLVSLGSRRPEDITVRGYGAEQPLGDNNTTEGQALNRRVEITILDE